MSTAPLKAALDAFSETLTSNFAVAKFNPAQAEDQLKGPSQTLLKAAGKKLGFEVEARTEATKAGHATRPDIGVSVGKLLTGHIELKAPDKGAVPSKFTDTHDKAQWKKLQDHPNLIYTDGNEWALYREGTRVGSIVRAAGNVTADGKAAFDDAGALALETLLRDFYSWTPLVPKAPKALAEVLAPLCRLLREAATEAVSTSGSALAQLADEWRQYLFPDADDGQFADAYAQTVTYALLLARFEGETDLHSKAAERLDARHGLLAQVLRILEDPSARKEVQVPIELLERAVGAVDVLALTKKSKGADPWLYFYEDFLAAYDPKLRKNRGVYYTPAEVVQAQVRLTAELLEHRFGKSLTFVDDEVVVLDPAVGTGTYLLSALAHGLEQVRSKFGDGSVSNRATTAAANFHGFELLIGPYAVAHLRFAQQILAAKGVLPADGVQVYLTDTLESPYTVPLGQLKLTLTHKKLTEENTRARKVKSDTRVLVCLGNPPYFRQVIDADDDTTERQGGWVRYGDDGKGGILDDFLVDVPGVHAKNLYNLYVYFWRWALWKVFETNDRGGVLSFISAASYLRGPGFTGMRRLMRETFDELWIIDLQGDNLGPRKTENVFAIQNPVAIAIGVRTGLGDSATPALVRYSRFDGSREEKLEALADVRDFSSVEWQRCFNGWTEPFLPENAGAYYDWPLLTDLLPWQHSGLQYKRKWPIAPTREVLAERWRALLAAKAKERGALLHETRDRQADRDYPPLMEGLPRLAPLDTLPQGEPVPDAIPYAYRSFDRQFALADNRLGDFVRPVLWAAHGPEQVYLTSLLSGVLGLGPAATVTALLPDLDHFRGSFGAKHVIPLWRDAAGTEANIVTGLLELLSTELGSRASPDDFFAYCYGVLAAPSYVEKFSEELTWPGPRLPITKDSAKFAKTVALGRHLVWLHTYAERFIPPGKKRGEVPPGATRCTVGVSSKPTEYPESFSYDPSSETLLVGGGAFAPVAPAVYLFSVSGLEVVKSWLSYRMRAGYGKRSSSLDDIRQTQWTSAFTEELLRLLWILEATVELQPELDSNLENIVVGATFKASELPTPSTNERTAPATVDSSHPKLDFA